MLSSVEQAFLGRDEKRAPLKTPEWETINNPALGSSWGRMNVFIVSIPNEQQREIEMFEFEMHLKKYFVCALI